MNPNPATRSNTDTNNPGTPMRNAILAAAAAASLLFSATASAGISENEEVAEATAVLTDFVNIPENAIPAALLDEAQAIAVIPSVLRVGFIIGGRRGSGVVSVRTDSGEWSNPAFVTLTGGSIGWQIGASSTDLILIFKSDRPIAEIADGEITLGADASVAAGPVGRSASAATTADLEAEIYSYSRSRGLFAGVAIEGAVLSIDDTANADFYGKPSVGPYEILRNTDSSGIPKVGQKFVHTLNWYLREGKRDQNL